MKGLVSILALAIALPSRARPSRGRETRRPQRPKPIARRLAACGMLQRTRAQRRSRKPISRLLTVLIGRRLLPAPFSHVTVVQRNFG